MVLHQDKSVEDYSALAQVVCQLREESLAVVIAVKNVRAAVAAAGDMIHVRRENQCVVDVACQQFIITPASLQAIKC